MSLQPQYSQISYKGRNTQPLTKQQIEEVKAYAATLGIPTHLQLKDVLAEINQCVDGLYSISYINNSQQFISLSVKEFQYTTSINDRVNLFFLLDLDNLPDDLIPGITVYKNTPKITSDSSIVISASSIE